MSGIGQFLEPRETTLTRLTGDLPFDLQEQIGEDVLRRRAGEKIARFGQRQMRVPFVQSEDPDEPPEALESRMRDAIRHNYGFARRTLRRDIRERGIMNRFGRRISTPLPPRLGLDTYLLDA
jgi:hypothetical protein